MPTTHNTGGRLEPRTAAQNGEHHCRFCAAGNSAYANPVGSACNPNCSTGPDLSGFEDALALFAPACTQDLNRVALQKRTDTKFLLPFDAACGLVAELTGDYKLLRAAARGIATYRTLYFDTADLDSYHMHRRGYRRRQKFRIRHYVDRSVSFIELKQRLGTSRTIKMRRELESCGNLWPKADFTTLGSGICVRGSLRPQVWTDFQRITLVAGGAPERVTIDCNLRFANADNHLDLLRVVVVEVKQERFCNRTPIMGTLRRMGARPRKFSKYCAAVMILHPGIRRNRLLPQLRAMERLEHG